MRVYDNEDQENVTCQCDHLTSFSILLVSIQMIWLVNYYIHRHQNKHNNNYYHYHYKRKLV